MDWEKWKQPVLLSEWKKNNENNKNIHPNVNAEEHKNWLEQRGLNNFESVKTYFKNIFKKYGPKHLQRFFKNLHFVLEKEGGFWANVEFDKWDSSPVLTIHPRLLNPNLPVLMKKFILLHELTHFFDSNVVNWRHKDEKLNEHFHGSLDEETGGHAIEFAQKFNEMMFKHLNINNPNWKHPVVTSEEEYEDLYFNYMSMNRYARGNFIFENDEPFSKRKFGKMWKETNEDVEKRLNFLKQKPKIEKELKQNIAHLAFAFNQKQAWLKQMYSMKKNKWSIWKNVNNNIKQLEKEQSEIRLFFHKHVPKAFIKKIYKNDFSLARMLFKLNLGHIPDMNDDNDEN